MEDKKCEDIIIEIFRLLIYFFGVDIAIIYLYKINLIRGKKI